MGLLQFDGFNQNDITYYENYNSPSLPNVPLDTVLLDNFDGNPIGNTDFDTEVCLDIEMAISMAPGLSDIVVYEAGPYGNYDDIITRMATDNTCKQLSSSWSVNGDSKDSYADQVFQEMAAQGQSFFQASGDDDAIIDSTWISGGDTVYSYFGFPCDDPNITQLGGTTLTTSGAGGSYVSETVWNTDTYYPSHHAFLGSSGGVSTLYSIPTWQQNANPSNSQMSSSERYVPDVALTADNVYVRADNADWTDQGTSCAAPLWAGFTALANEQSAHNGQNPIGFLNPLIYAIGQSELYSSDFHDTPAGSNNAWPGSSGQYAATSGFDLATGWGTPDGQHLINDLASTIWSGDTAFSSNFTVSSGQTVAIMPGANITFSNGAGIIVHGTLNVYGTSSQPVTMTSSSGTWAGITFAGSSTGNLQDCTISSASSPVIIDTANVTING